MNITKIMDIISNKNVWKYYKLYQKTQWFDPIEMNRFQIRKLQTLLRHCYDNVPYYTQIMDEIKIRPEDVNNKDILKEFPLLTKEIIQNNYNSLIPLNISKLKGVKYGQTGGTTGNILFKRTDANTRSSTWATFKRYLDWMNIKDSDRKLYLMGGHVIHSNIDIKKIIADGLRNITSFNPYNNNQKDTEKIINSLEKKSYKLIRGYSQNLFHLARILDERGFRFNVPAISTTAESLMDEHRKLFKDVFGSDSFDQYGGGEIGGIAYECNHHKGLHVSEERVILETNENNDLIITDLDNYSMPYICYWNADQAILSNEQCSCGRQSLLIKKIMGRTCDYIFGKEGKSIHWAYFWHLVFESNIAYKRNVRKFQIRQISEDEILFRLVAEKLDSNEENIIAENITKKLGNMNIRFIYEKDIENSPSGKYQPVVNKIVNK